MLLPNQILFIENMTHENDSDDLAPNFHGSYTDPFEEKVEDLSTQDAPIVKEAFESHSDSHFGDRTSTGIHIAIGNERNATQDEKDIDWDDGALSYGRSRHFLGRSALIVLIAAALILGGVFIGIYGWGESDELVVEQVEVPTPEPIPPADEQVQQEEVPLPEAEILELDEIVEPVTAVAAAVSPSVVRIDTSTGTGSGIILDSSGRVVTNAHVVNGAQKVDIRFADGTRAQGTVLGSDPNVDIAIVRIEGDATFEEAEFASSDTVQVGQLAVAIGSPFGLEQSVTAGIVSAVNRAVQHANIIDGSTTVMEMIQTDAPINPGNSGGALADRQGRVIGMNTSIRTDGIVSGNLGVGFAIPSDTILLVAERIVNGESLDVGFLGLTGQDSALGRPGALIIDVLEGCPALEWGLLPGDLVVSVDGSPILGISELAAKTRITSPGTSVEIGVIRNGEEVFFVVVLGTVGCN